MRVVLVLIVCVVAAAVSLGARQAAVQSLYSLKVPALSGETRRSEEIRGQGHARRERRQPMRIHAAVQGPAAAAHRALATRFLGARLPEQRLRRPGARDRYGDQGLLREELRRDVSDVLEGRHQGGSRPVRRSTRSSARPATCRSGTSASTSSERTARVVAFFPSKVAPDAPELRQAIEKALGSS